MKIISFDPFRSLGCQGLQYIKSEHIDRERELILAADLLLFPDYGDLNLLHFVMGKAIFPSVNSYLLGYNKIEMTRAFQSCFPINMPLTLIVPNTESYRESIREQLAFPFVAKLTRSSRGEGVFLIENNRQWLKYCEITDMLYVQEKLDIDRDIRLVWIGNRIVHAYWRVAAAGSFHNNVAHGGRIQLDEVPEAAIKLVTEVANRLNIDYAGFDVAMVNGHPYLFEFNRLFGMEAINMAKIKTGVIIYEYITDKYQKKNHGRYNPDPETDTSSG